MSKPRTLDRTHRLAWVDELWPGIGGPRDDYIRVKTWVLRAVPLDPERDSEVLAHIQRQEGSYVLSYDGHVGTGQYCFRYKSLEQAKRLALKECVKRIDESILRDALWRLGGLT